MRILQVRFKNLNSLVGEWQIDLTHPAFASDGIFAIIGPTGAGKTTILDAICLALYGRTPRLSRVTKSGNEIMSRQTGECFAEVTFETQTGRYRCHWSQHRARRKPGGELQSPKHEIANADSGEIFESKIRGVADQIESATGMDFDRFTRSMLLAQGGFAAFLQAAADERAPILEQITGTEIYSEISIRVHERQRAERDKLNLLQAETTGIVILEAEQEQEIAQALETRQKEETGLATKSADTRKAITWLTTIEELKRDIRNLTDESDKLQHDIETFKPDRERLNRALNAATLDGAYATLTALRKQQAEDREASKTEAAALPELESAAKEQAEIMKKAEQKALRSKEDLQAFAPTLQKIRSLDQTLAAQEKTVRTESEACNREAGKIDADTQANLKEQEKRRIAQQSLARVDNYLKEHARDEWLVSGLTGAEEQLKGLLSMQSDVYRKEAAQEKATLALQQATEAFDSHRKQSHMLKQELENASKQLQHDKDALSQLLAGRLLREYRTEKDTLLREVAFLNKIAALEDHRAKLENGKACPLCGATEHPFAEGPVPGPDKTEQKIEALSKLINRAEDQITVIEKSETAENQARTNLLAAERQESTAANDQKAAERNLAEAKDSLAKLQTGFVERGQAVSTLLRPLGIAELPEKDISTLLETLKIRLKDWLAQVKMRRDIEKQIADFDSGIKRLDAVIETQSTALAEKRERLAALKAAFTNGSDERSALYGDKNPDEEERRLNRAISETEGLERQARDRHTQLQQQWHTAQAHFESLNKRIDQREPALEKMTSDFLAALTPIGFSDEAQFLQAQLSTEQRSELSARANELNERQTNLKARQKDRETRLAAEVARKVTNQSLDELESQFTAYEESLNKLRDHIAGLNYQLSENTAAKERIKDKQTAIESQSKECRRWDNLHELIGSSDGKKYRNFAQGLTFEMMVSHANRQLQKMTDRYLLVRHSAQPLELNVVDNYQAGEIRSTKNLSGGESFIVSLSLALGLSHMASKNVRVDSLFLDEGFGTLDEEALDTALETLASLQQDGKLIGVISHVSALKERISTQIQVSPQTGGRSQISGPGCSGLGTEEQVVVTS